MAGTSATSRRGSAAAPVRPSPRPTVRAARSASAGAAAVAGRAWGGVVSAARRRPVRALWDLVVATVEVCMRYRVTGLAAEAGFFALLSLPPLVLGLAGTAAWVGSELGTATREQLVSGIESAVGQFLTTEAVESVITPTLEEAISGPRFDLISIGFVLSLWSGSRALNVYIDTISIMYGLGGHRGIVRTRALSFTLYLLTLVLAAFTLPLVLIGPSLLGRALPDELSWLLGAYWPVVGLAGIALLTTLYHVATPIRSPWRRDLAGALLALVIWVLASWVMRLVIAESVGGASIYGPLATPIIVLIWLYLIAIAVLIGAGLNAAVDRLWPDPRRAAARLGPAAHGDEMPLTPVEPGVPAAHCGEDGEPPYPPGAEPGGEQDEEARAGVGNPGDRGRRQA
ncbi:YihY/virulence factor BrkB family protein [Thalassiella azotivora]